MKLSAGRAVDLLRAAGEPTRLRILQLLTHGELAVMELAQLLDQSQPRVSRHLKLLTDAGLVDRFPDGAWMFYRLTLAGEARDLLDALLVQVDAADPALARDAERLARVRESRDERAAGYFARNAARWDEIRSLHVAETEVETAVLEAAGPGPFDQLVDLGSGAGRMLTLLGPRARRSVGLDLSQSMLNLARVRAGEAGLAAAELRHGDIMETGLPARSADLVVVHQVLHYLADPAGAVAEAARLVAPGGRLLIVDFAPHGLESLREAHQHRRLGFASEEVGRWLAAAGLESAAPRTLPPAAAGGLTVMVWAGLRPAGDNVQALSPKRTRSAA